MSFFYRGAWSGSEAREFLKDKEGRQVRATLFAHDKPRSVAGGRVAIKTKTRISTPRSGSPDKKFWRTIAQMTSRNTIGVQKPIVCDVLWVRLRRCVADVFAVSCVLSLRAALHFCSMLLAGLPECRAS